MIPNSSIRNLPGGCRVYKIYFPDKTSNGLFTKGIEGEPLAEKIGGITCLCLWIRPEEHKHGHEICIENNYEFSDKEGK